jgi:hypothetical protein
MGAAREVYDRLPDDQRGHWMEGKPPASASAPAVVYLLSDLAAGIHGQIVRVNGTELSLISRPSILLPLEEKGAASVDSVQQAFDTTLKDLLQPAGLRKVHLEVADG